MRNLSTVFVSLLIWLGQADLSRSQNNPLIIKNYDQWNSMSIDAKRGLITGYWEAALVSKGPGSVPRRNGLEDCADALSLNVNELVKQVEQFYMKNPRYKRFEPWFVFGYSVEEGICKSYVNKWREKEGLPPHN